MLTKHGADKRIKGFTLIELSIVLVIIGLLAGGILVGQELINAAYIRAQISQIDKYQAAVKAFRLKYNALPGDMSADAANAFGFTARGAYAGEGDNNGIIEGVTADAPGSNYGRESFGGETLLFWIDLGQANLIDSTISATGKTIFTPPMPGPLAQAQLQTYIPQAKIGQGGYVYVWSGGWPILANQPQDGYNYFGLSLVYGPLTGNTSLTPQQAYAIDTKIDDGRPQSGKVSAIYVHLGVWAIYSPPNGPMGNNQSGDYNSTNGGPVTNPADIGDSGDGNPADTCFDGNTGLPEKYSLTNTALNCALSFRFQ